MKILNLIFLLAFASCQFLQPKQEGESEVIAEVGDETLTKEDIQALIPKGVSSEDSADYVEKFAIDWVKKKLMIKKAEETIDFNEARIKNRVLDYQYALMVHEYEQKYIEQNLKEEVSDALIEKYYEEKSENFILRENLIKCIYVKLPLDAPKINRFRRFFRNYPRDSIDFWNYTNQFSLRTYSDIDSWVKFDEVIVETPLIDLTDKQKFLTANSSIEVSDEAYTYFIKILNKKLIGETAPIDFIKGNIADIIINNRKIQLKKALEKKIYEEAVEENEFEIYRK